MNLQNKTIDFGEESERLRDEMEEVAERQVKYEGNPEKEQELMQLGNELNNQINLLQILADEWGEGSVTLTGLTAGEVNRVEDTVEDNPGVRERDAWVAIGTREAPYVEHDPDAVVQEDFEETVAAVTDLPLAYVRWAEGRISELSHLSEESGNGYLELVREKQADKKGERGG